MNGVVINLRGINASGKSTAVREYCKEHNMKPRKISFHGYDYNIMTNESEYALGHYKPFSDSEGLDSLKADKEEFKLFLRWFLQQFKPVSVIYEKQIWSTTFKLTSEIAEICKKEGYRFAAVLMKTGYQESLNRLFERNGGNDINLDGFDNRYKAVYRSSESLLRFGIPLFCVDVDNTKKEDMKKICGQAVFLTEKGEKRGFIPYPE